MRLSRALEEKILDLRLRDKLIAEGKVTQAQVDEFLSSLGDDEANVTTTDESQAPGMKK
ncbi:MULTISPECIES: hypothetical protein [unclassified Halobacteriovorax]|uniref:hypothetical protein n=1 Tax=unclassified Halobacteriovorax TaxID=2639665 RepID=UPI000EB6A618|nr:hypothetical protein [Halobacteriovorax sp. BALOs_7]AYF44886.1 hypothetical protein BALOs_1886 [Halobacteriovorax sp. BALOs_7]